MNHAERLRSDWSVSRWALQQQLQQLERGDLDETVPPETKQVIASALRNGIAMFDQLLTWKMRHTEVSQTSH